MKTLCNPGHMDQVVASNKTLVAGSCWFEIRNF